MTQRRIKRINHIDTTLDVAGAKIYGMHALAISTLARGKTHIENILINDDFLTFLNALEKLGVESDYTYSSKKQTRDIIILGIAGQITPYLGELHIQNSRTSLYFLMSMLNLGSGIYCVSTGGKLKECCLVEVENILNSMGVNTKLKDEKYPPVLLEAKGFRGGKLHFDKRITNQEQVIAPLLVSAPYGENPLEITFEDDAKVNAHIDITIDCMKHFGVEVENHDYKLLRVNNNQEYTAPEKIKIEPDVAISVHFFAIAALVGGRVRIENINYYNTKQEYIRFVDILEEMGCTVVKDKYFIEVSRDINQELKPVHINMQNMKMLVQLLSVVALRCSGESILTNCFNMEDGVDRLAIISSEFRNLGAYVERLDQNTIKIVPEKHYSPATIDTSNDYRTAMAFSLLGTFIDGIFILDQHSLTKTYASFFDVLDDLAKRRSK